MIIWTIGLEGCGHHGLEPVIKDAISPHMTYYARKELQNILNEHGRNGEYDILNRKLNHFFNQNKNGLFYIDASYPARKWRKISQQWEISKLYSTLSSYLPTKIIHLKRNIFNTTNSHPNWDGGIINHAKKLREIDFYIKSELSILKSMDVEITEINYESIPEKAASLLSSILNVKEKTIQQSIDKRFKISHKDYNKILDEQTIDQLKLIFNKKINREIIK